MNIGCTDKIEEWSTHIKESFNTLKKRMEQDDPLDELTQLAASRYLGACKILQDYRKLQSDINSFITLVTED